MREDKSKMRNETFSFLTFVFERIETLETFRIELAINRMDIGPVNYRDSELWNKVSCYGKINFWENRIWKFVLYDLSRTCIDRISIFSQTKTRDKNLFL